MKKINSGSSKQNSFRKGATKQLDAKRWHDMRPALRRALTDRPLQTVDVDAMPRSPMKAPGCVWQFWSGSIGLNDRSLCFDGGSPVGYATDMSDRSRKALANYMIGLWTKFRDETPRH